MKRESVKWHKMTAGAAVTQLHTNAACGLSRKAARSRCRKMGNNTLFAPLERYGRREAARAFLLDPSVLLLLFVLACSILFSSLFSSLFAILAFLGATALALRIMGTFTVLQQTVERYRTPIVLVLRDGVTVQIPASEIAVGDILLLQKGDVVPCDCRLLEVRESFRTRLLFLDEKGRRVVVDQIKDADTVYPYESSVCAPQCVNMLYGRSEVLSGYARAVAVEVGDCTFMGALRQGRGQDSERRSLQRFCSGVDAPIRISSTLVTLLLIPLCIIGFFRAPEDYDVLRIFLPMATASVVVSQGALTFFFQSILARGYVKCMKNPQSPQNRSILKSTDALEKLSDVTDLIVLGKSASSDGILHLHRVMLGDGEIDLSRPALPGLGALCEAYELLLEAPAASRDEGISACGLLDLESSSVREELLEKSGYDRKALQIRTRRTEAHYHSDRIELDAAFQVEECRLVFSDRLSLLASCSGYERDGRIYPLEAQTREELRSFAASAMAEGGRVTVVTRTSGGRTVLLGILSAREAIQPFLPSVVEELRQSGVGVSFVFFNADESLCAYLQAAKLPREVLFASDVEDPSKLIEYYGKYRVFAGFSRGDVKLLLKKLRQSGHRIAVLGNELEDVSLQAEASLRIASEPRLSLNARARRENADTQMHTCPVLSSHAQMLLPFAGEQGGGLYSFLYALSQSRALHERMRLLLKYLTSVNLLRLSVLLLSVIFGVGIWNASHFLIGGLAFDLIALVFITNVFIPQSRLRRIDSFDRFEVKKIMGEKQILLSSLATGCLLWLYILIWSLTSHMSAKECVSFSYVSVLLVQVMMLCRIAYAGGNRFHAQKDLQMIGWTILPSALLLALSCLIPSLGAVSELASMTVIGYASLPLGPCLYILLDAILIRRNRTSRHK